MPRARFRLLFLLLSTASILAWAQPPTPRSHAPSADKEVLLRFKVPISQAILDAVAQAHDARDIRRVGGTRLLYRLRSRSRDVDRLVQELSTRPDILFAEPNYQVRALAAPDDPGFPQLWGLQNTGQSSGSFAEGTPGADISAVSAWDVSTGSTAHAIGIVDTGIDYTHPDLQANLWSAPSDFTLTIGGTTISCPAGSHGFNAIAWTCNPMDDNRHGTHVAGTIGAQGNNSLGVVGVNWTTQIIALKFLDAGGSGYVSDAVNAIEFAIQLKNQFGTAADLRVLSNSWGGGGFSQALSDEIQRAADNGILFVAAAGNSSSNNDVVPQYPASFAVANMVAVAATDNNDQLAGFSSYGATSVHLGAPGVNIYSTLPGATYGYLSGTSMATPHVSGAAMLVLSACDLTTADLKQTLITTVDPIPALAANTISGGRLNVNSAIRSCSGPVSLSPLTVTFGKVQLGTSSSARQLTLTNRQDVALNLVSITATGPEFTMEHNCGSSVSAHSSCSISVTFTPVSMGDRRGSLEVEHDAANGPLTAVLSGAGTEDPDLRVAAVSSSQSAVAPGAILPVTVTTLNQGLFSAANSITGLYLSANGVHDTKSIFLVDDPVPSLVAGGSFTHGVSALIPSNVKVGTYQVIACADDSQSIAEADESNNCLASSPITLQTALPDLGETAVSFTPPSSGPGKSVTVTDTVTNNSSYNAGPSTTRYYVSTNAFFSSNAILLAGSRAVGALAAGQTSAGSASVSLPATLITGAYFVLACADDTQQVGETNENNNCAASSTQLQVGPDLTQAGVTQSANKAGAAGTLTVNETVNNPGGGDAAASVTQFYLSTNTIKNTNSRLLSGNRSVPSVTAGTGSSGSTLVTLPADVAVGNYYVLACADDTQQLKETNENNNCAASSTQLQVGPDLTEAAVTLGASKAGAGGSLTVNETVNNLGGGDAMSSLTQFYLSTNAIKNSNSRLLSGSRSVPSATAGTGSSGSTIVTLPQDVTVGNYYVLACADDTQQVKETNENNNCSASNTQLQVGPDLVESAVMLAANKSGAGGSLTVNETVNNLGGGDAAASVSQFYLSSNTIKNANSRLLAGSRGVAPATAGTGSSGSTLVTLPPDVTVGNYYVLACADDTQQVKETNENNNCAGSTTQLQVGPDLTESAVTLGAAKAGAGGSLTVNETVNNLGGGDAAASLTQFYLSSNTIKNANSRLLSGSRSVPAVPAATMSSASTVVTLPVDLAVGNYYVLACADDAQQVKETNESNNCAASTTQLQVGPDLSEAAVTLGASKATPGGSVMVSETANNPGGGDAAASLTQFYLSSNTIKNANSRLLSGSRSVPGIPAATGSSGSTIVTLPSDVAAGKYYVLACADDTQQVKETNENNNCSASWTLLQVTMQ